MSPNSMQFAKVLVLFFLQGQLVWLLSFWSTHVVNQVAGIALFGAIVAWWPLWFALHRERTWRPWLETMLLMGATFWLPLFADQWVRPLINDGQNYLIPPQAILYLMLFYGLLFCPVVACLWLGIRQLIGWQWQSPYAVRVSLRDFFMILAAASLHLVGFLPMLQESVHRGLPPLGGSEWVEIAKFTLFLSSVLASLTFIVLGSAALVVGERIQRGGLICTVLGVLGLGIATAVNQMRWSSGFSVDLAVAAAVISAQAALTSLALRCFGYRLAKSARHAALKTAP